MEDSFYWRRPAIKNSVISSSDKVTRTTKEESKRWGSWHREFEVGSLNLKGCVNKTAEVREGGERGFRKPRKAEAGEERGRQAKRQPPAKSQAVSA